MNMNFQEYFKNEIFMCKLCGVWIHFKKSKYDFFYYIYWAVLNILMITYIIMKVQYMLTFDDVYGMVGAGYILPISMTGIIRSYSLFKYRKEFNELITTLDDEIFQPRDLNEQKMYQRMLKFFYFYKNLLYVWTFSTLLGCHLGKIVFGIHEGPDTGRDHCEAAMSTKHGILMYFYQATTISMIFVLSYMSELFMVGFSLFLGTQCDRLCYQLENLEHKDIDNIKNLTVYYKRILRFAKNNERLFGTVYFIFFFACLFAISSTLFMFSTTDPYTFTFYHMLEYVCALFGMLFTPCWFSTEVLKKSEKIPLAAYASGWVDAGKKFKNDLLIFMYMVQTPIQFTAWNLIPLSMDSYIAVVKTSFSYFTVLNNMMETDE